MPFVRIDNSDIVFLKKIIHFTMSHDVFFQKNTIYMSDKYEILCYFSTLPYKYIVPNCYFIVNISYFFVCIQKQPMYAVYIGCFSTLRLRFLCSN